MWCQGCVPPLNLPRNIGSIVVSNIGPTVPNFTLGAILVFNICPMWITNVGSI